MIQCLGQGQSLLNFHLRPLGITKQPGGPCGEIQAANTRIVTTEMKCLGSMRLDIIKAVSRFGMLQGLQQIAAGKTRCPGRMVGLQGRAGIVLTFGQVKKLAR